MKKIMFLKYLVFYNSMTEEVISTMIYFKNFAKCHNVPPVQEYFKKEKFKKGKGLSTWPGWL
jgi:hypothetical protein